MCVTVGALQISANEFDRLVLEHLDIRLAQREVGQNDLLDDLAQDGLVVEAFGVLVDLGDRGQELQSLADQDVVLGLGTDGGQEGP